MLSKSPIHFTNLGAVLRTRRLKPTGHMGILRQRSSMSSGLEYVFNLVTRVNGISCRALVLTVTHIFSLSHHFKMEIFLV